MFKSPLKRSWLAQQVSLLTYLFNPSVDSEVVSWDSFQGSDIFEYFLRILHFWCYFKDPEKKVIEKDTRHDLFMLRYNH